MANTAKTPTTVPEAPQDAETPKVEKRNAPRYKGPIKLEARSEEPMVRKSVDLSPFMPWVERAKELREQGSTNAVSFTTFTDAVTSVSGKLRQCAEKMDIGLRIVSIDQADADPKYNLLPNESRMQIVATARREFKPRGPRNPKPAETVV